MCDLLSNPDKYPLIKNGIKNFDIGFPGLIQKCPYKALRISNATLGPPIPISRKDVSDFRIFPNGIYKVTLTAADHPSQPFNAITVSLYIESRIFNKNFETSA